MTTYTKGFFVLSFTLWAMLSVAQTQDTTQVEENYDQYDNLAFAAGSTKIYCSPKVLGLSPQRFLSVAWDVQLAHRATFSGLGAFSDGTDPVIRESGNIRGANGLRFGANIPVISKNSIVWQMGASFWNTDYRVNDIVLSDAAAADNAQLLQRLNDRGLRTAGLNTTVFTPLGEKTFLLFQGSADLNGDYTFSDMQSLRYLRYSAAAVWGKRPNDRKQWGLGIARTYRVGEMNYIPVVLFNWTSENRKWGTEVLFPARGHVRRTFSARQMLLAGYELEGQSYRIGSLSDNNRSLEIRRGEMRTRLEYQRNLAGFVWLSAQLGWRYNWNYNADYLNNNGREFFRGFFGDQPYAMLNRLQNPLYFNIGIHLVSP